MRTDLGEFLTENENENGEEEDTYVPFGFSNSNSISPYSPYYDRKRLLEEYNREMNGMTTSNSADYDDEEEHPNNGQRRHNLNEDTTHDHDTNPVITSKVIMKVVGNILASITILSFLIGLPTLAYYYATYKKHNDTHKFTAALTSAGTFVLITIIISIRQIHHHLTNWYMPDVQKYVVRLLFMVPLYAIQSFLSLSFHEARIYIDTLRDLYEAFVIQSFLYYLMELLGGEEELVSILEGKDEHYGHHEAGFQYVIRKPWNMGLEFLLQCKGGVVQYVVVKTLATLATAILEPFDLYGEGQFGWQYGYTYISFFINISQMWALYCLIKFYHATSDDLRGVGESSVQQQQQQQHSVGVSEEDNDDSDDNNNGNTNWHPLGKFLCVKGVVFFTWWQGVGIAMLQSRGVISTIGTWDADDVANGLQDYLVCVEMFCFAIAHAFTFTHLEYLPKGKRNQDNEQSTGGISRRRARRSGETNGTGGTRNKGIRSGVFSRLRDSYNYNRRNEDNDDDDSSQELLLEDDDDEYYKPPTIRTLNAPMRVRDALWSSTSVREETMSEIKRFRYGVSDQVRNDQNSELGNVVHMTSMQYAESI